MKVRIVFGPEVPFGFDRFVTVADFDCSGELGEADVFEELIGDGLGQAVQVFRSGLFVWKVGSSDLDSTFDRM